MDELRTVYVCIEGKTIWKAVVVAVVTDINEAARWRDAAPPGMIRTVSDAPFFDDRPQIVTA